MTDQKILFRYILRLADNALILGHRLSEQTSKGPFLEEDIATANVALDLIGRSGALLQYAAEVEGEGRTEDDLAFLRNEREFYNTLLSELPAKDFAVTITRLFFISAFDYFFFEELKKSSDATLAGIAEKSHKEITYHLRHASKWMERLGDGTEESHTRLQNAVNDLWRFTGEFF
jgi:ring-1,2-phenylacetyl-CoA epoxidase subunit PaaC